MGQSEKKGFQEQKENLGWQDQRALLGHLVLGEGMAIQGSQGNLVTSLGTKARMGQWAHMGPKVHLASRVYRESQDLGAQLDIQGKGTGILQHLKNQLSTNQKSPLLEEGLQSRRALHSSTFYLACLATRSQQATLGR